MSNSLIHKIYNVALNYIYPRYCVLCNHYLSGNTDYKFLCMNCVNRLIYIGNDICHKCGNPFSGNDFYSVKDNNKKICFKCQEHEPLYQSARSVLKLNKLAKMLIYQFKYQNGQFLVHDMISLSLHNQHFMDLINNSILVPVPLHWRKKFVREYNQSEVFALHLIKHASNTQVLNLLKKPKSTRPQVGLLAEERLANIQNAFDLTQSAFLIPKSAKIVIIDDVLTTGATLSQCVLVFKNHGFENIHIASFART